MKMIKFILMFVVLFVVPQTSFTQHFQRLHDCDTTSDFGTNIFVLPDGTYLTFSASLSYTTNRRESIWMNISADGTASANLKRIASDSFNYYQGRAPGQVRKLSDGGYLLPTTLQSTGRSSWGLIRLNAQFDTVWMRFYTDTATRFEDVDACIIMSNGDYLIGGYTGPNGLVRDSALLTRTDSNGNVIWQKRYKKLPTSAERPCIVSLDVLDSNTVLVGAMSTHTEWISQFDFYGHNTPWFMIIDGAGNIIKDTAYVNTHFAGGGKSVQRYLRRILSRRSV